MIDSYTTIASITMPIIPVSWNLFADPYVFPLDDFEREMLGPGDFMGKEAIMGKLERDWRPVRGMVTINVLEGDEQITHRATHKRVQMFVLPNGEETAFVELARLSDLHGVVGLYSGSIWLKRVSDPEELNIDADVMDMFRKILKQESEKEAQRLMEESQKMIMRNSMYGFGGSK